MKRGWLMVVSLLATAGATVTVIGSEAESAPAKGGMAGNPCAKSGR